MSSRAPKVAGRSRIEQVLFKRSGKIYDGMKERAAELYMKVPFTKEEFRLWLALAFGNDGEARCEYSGEMILVENFSVDHRRPISRGGCFTLGNLALCSEKQNLRKGNMTKEEYTELTKHVSRYAPEVQAAIWRKLEVGDVQRFSYYRRQRKAVKP